MADTDTKEEEFRKAVVEEADDVTKKDSNHDDDDTECGFGPYHPSTIQCFAKAGCFTGFYSMAGLLSATLTVYVNSQVTTLERQFGFSSKQTAIIMAANDIGFLACVLFVSYVANMVHIPRALAITTILYGISGMMCALPHFLYGHNTNQDLSMTTSMTSDSLANQSNVLNDQDIYGQLCQYENRSLLDSCQDSGTDSKLSRGISQQDALTSLIIIVFGMICQGMGKSPRYPFTVTYIDSNTEPTKTGFYIGIIIAFGILGPALAFTLGGVFSRMYVTLEETNLTPRHPRWIGAWWLGYVVFGLTAIVVSLPLFCFPRRLPRKGQGHQPEAQSKKPIYKGSEAIMAPRKSEYSQKLQTFNGIQKFDYKSKPVLSRKMALMVKDFVYTLLRLWTNPVYMLMVFSKCFIIFAVAGMAAYTPKYLERIFDLPTDKANYIMAGKTLLSSCVGTLVGGYLTKRLKLPAFQSLVFSLIVSVLGILMSVACFLSYCEQPETHNSPWSSPACASDCHCEDNSYFPVCGDDGLTYYSPCAAGCQTSLDGSYFNCTCIEDGTANRGICPYTCDRLYFYIIAFGLGALFGTMAIVPQLTVIIRSVHECDRALAMGFVTFMMALLGWCIGPILFGSMIDGVCVIWDINCGVSGRCVLYDNNLFRVRLHTYSIVAQGACSVCVLVALIYARCTGVLDGKQAEDTPSAAQREGEGTTNEDGGISVQGGIHMSGAGDATDMDEMI